MKYLFFRVDSSYLTASGHLVRCQRLAQIFQKKYEVIFLVNKFKGNFNFIIKKFKKIYLDHNNEKNLNSKNDSRKTIKILKRYNGKKILFVDNYNLNFTWHKKVRKHVDKLVCINDYLKKNYCDYLINETYYSENVSQKCLKKNTKILSGPKYALIKKYKAKKSKKNGIFVFLGSVDEKNITIKLLQILKKIINKNIYIVIGKKNKNRNKILKIQNKKFFKISKFTNLNLYLNKCDTAIVGGGSIVWETLYNKLNTIVILTAKNQLQNIKNLKKDKIVNTLSINQLNEDCMSRIILQAKNKKSKNIVDGNGLKRIYKEINKIV